jgi:phosphate transport system substrate-binding protein
LSLACRLRALLLAPLAVAGIAAAQSLVKVDGSSTVYPLTEAAAEAWRRSGRATARVTIGISGTTGGFRKFCRAETDVAAASRPIGREEMAECERRGVRYVELPVAYDAITVVVHRRSPLESITVDELRRLWEPAAEGKVQRWSQVRPALPSTPIRLFAPGADSGTFEYFTEAIVGRARASRRDVVASEDDEVLVEGIARDTGALGYFGYAYFAEHRTRLRALAIAVDGGPAVAPSAENVANGTYRPLSRPVFLYVNAAAARRAEVRGFVEHYLREGGRWAAEAKCIPLPAKAYALGLEAFQRGRVGTRFGGENRVGLTVDELMRLEAIP